MTEEEAVKKLDNVFTDMLVKQELGEEYSTAIKVVLKQLKYYKDRLNKELNSKFTC